MLLIIYIFHKTAYRLYTYKNSIFKHLLWYIASAVHSIQYKQQQTRDIFRYSFVLWWYLYIVNHLFVYLILYPITSSFSRFITLPHSPILKHKLRHQTHMPMKTWKEEEDARKGEQCKPFGILPTTIQLAEQTFACLLQYFFLSLLMSITTVKFATYRIFSHCNDFQFDHTHIPNMKSLWHVLGLETESNVTGLLHFFPFQMVYS